MIPNVQNDIADLEFEITDEPGRTYALNRNTNRIIGTCDEIEAITQTAYLILNIERYDYLIYSWNYGIELKDLYGEQISYVLPELKRRITEALTQDSRILGVNEFSFDVKQHNVHVTFTLNTQYGEIEMEKAVNI